MRTDEICQLVLRTCKAEGATDVVVGVGQSEGAMIRFANSEITVSDSTLDSSVSIFVSDGGKKAGTTVADLSKRALVNASKRIVSIAKKTPAAALYASLPKGPFKYDPALLETPVVSLSARNLTDDVRSAIDAATREGADRVAGSLIASNGKFTFQTSGDAFGVAKRGGLELSVRAFASELASGHAVSVSGTEKDFHPEQAGSEAGRMAKLALDPIDGTPGEFMAILGPITFAHIVNQVGSSASAFLVDSGLSFLADKMGQKVASEQLSVADDATMTGSYGSSPFDAEGLPTRRTRIIEQGVLRSYLHNSATAKEFGVESTANAGLVAPRASNLEVGAGTKTLDELLKQVDRGIYVTSDWYLRYQNYSTGDFSTIPRDAMFSIVDGRIDKPIRQLRMSDSILRILAGITGLTQDRQWIKWWEVETPTLAPTVLISSVKFTRSKM
jgi:PmbA protein